MMLNINTAQKADTEAAVSTKAADDNDGFKPVGNVFFNEPEEKEIIVPAESHFGKKSVDEDPNIKSGFLQFAGYSISYGRLYAAIAIAVVMLHIAYAGYIEYSNKKTLVASDKSISGVKSAEREIQSGTLQAGNKGSAGATLASPAMPVPRLVKVTDTSAIGKSDEVDLSKIQPSSGAAAKKESSAFHPIVPTASTAGTDSVKPDNSALQAKPDSDADIINILNKTN